MSILLKTPFRSNQLETDPLVYGLRPEMIRNAVVELYNDKSILITGSRGIGKSSLNYQLQRIVSGDKTILVRCGMDIDFGKYITVSYVCTPQDTLETVIRGIMRKFEKALETKEKKFKVKESSVELSLLGAIKASTKIEKSDVSYSTLLDNFVVIMRKFCEVYVDPHINIAIDELDQLPATENIAHFIKAALERLSSDDIAYVSFILVGQEILFQRLQEQQPAFHRLVKHIRLYPLNPENTEYVYDACLSRAELPVDIDSDAKKLLLSLTGGYPAVIQLLGHETFNCSLDKYSSKPEEIMIYTEDVLIGLKNAILNERVRFDSIFEELTGIEKTCLLTLADVSQKQIPFIYHFSNICDGILEDRWDTKKETAQKTVTSLLDKQILIFVKNEIGKDITQKTFCFREELFRIYLNDKMNNKERLDFD